MNTEKKWFCISMPGLGARGILKIQSLLDLLGYDGLLWSPTVKTPITKHGKQQNNDKPIFSGYAFIFCHISDSKLEQALMESKLGHFLKLPHDETHDLPTPISQEDIDHIKSLEEVDTEPIEEEIIDVQVGNLVEVCVGPFMGIKGIITEIKSRTAVIETIVFGRSAPVSVNINHLSKLTENIKDEKSAE